MRSLVVSYSLTGNVGWAAGILAKGLGAKQLCLEPIVSYPQKGLGMFLHGGKSAVLGETPVLKPYVFDAAGYDQVILCFPVWAGRPAAPMLTFVREQRATLQGMRLSALATQSGSGAEKALARLAQEAGCSAFFRTLILIDPRKRPSPEKEGQLDRFIQELR